MYFSFLDAKISLIKENVSHYKGFQINQICAKFLKDIPELISNLLYKITKSSINIAQFLSQCRTARLKSLLQEGTQIDPKN